MGKKFVPLSRRNIKIRLYLEDIHKVHKVLKKKLPAVPEFEEKVLNRE